MGPTSYSAFVDKNHHGLYNCSRASDEANLIVNCAGNFVTSSSFSTHCKGREDYYLIYIVAGTLKVEIDKGWQICRPGNFILFPPKTHYSYVHDSDDKLDYLWVHFTGYGVTDAVNQYGLTVYPEINEIKESNGIILRFQNIFDVFLEQDRFRDRELGLLLERLFIMLAKRKDEQSSRSNMLKKSLSHIQRYYNTQIKIPELAKIENLSVSRYNTVFKEILGLSPVEYITKLRITSACDLLSATDLSVTEISILIGYKDPHFFSRVFKSITGKSPKNYRICN